MANFFTRPLTSNRRPHIFSPAYKPLPGLRIMLLSKRLRQSRHMSRLMPCPSPRRWTRCTTPLALRAAKRVQSQGEGAARGAGRVRAHVGTGLNGGRRHALHYCRVSGVGPVAARVSCAFEEPTEFIWMLTRHLCTPCIHK